MKIKLKKPRTCSHCSAYVDSYCALGYETKRVPLEEAKTWVKFTTWEDHTVRLKPAEPCPKPKNISEKIAISKQIDVLRYSRPDSPEYKAQNNQDMTKEESHHHYINYRKD